MTDDYTLHAIDGTGSATNYAAPVSRTCDLLGLTVLAFPPGRVDFRISDMPAFLNVAPSASHSTIQKAKVADSDLTQRLAAVDGGGFDIFAEGADQELICVNHGWELLIDLDQSRLHNLAAETWDGAATLTKLHAGRTDPVAANLAQLAIHHLRFDTLDPLYVEGLAVALTARAVGFATGKGSAISVAGTDARVARAVEFIEANLAEELSLAAIADAARMSPSWLKSAFPAATGKPV